MGGLGGVLTIAELPQRRRAVGLGTCCAVVVTTEGWSLLAATGLGAGLGRVHRVTFEDGHVAEYRVSAGGGARPATKLLKLLRDATRRTLER
jgi:hypothetical protein